MAAKDGFFGTGRDWRIKALDRLEARDAHLDGACLCFLPDDEIETIGHRVVFKATGRADALVEISSAVAVGVGELVLLAQISGQQKGGTGVLEHRAEPDELHCRRAERWLYFSIGPATAVSPAMLLQRNFDRPPLYSH